MTYSVADNNAGYVADVSYSGEAVVPAPRVAVEQVFLFVFLLHEYNCVDAGEERRRSPKARPSLRKVGGQTKQGGQANKQAATTGHHQADQQQATGHQGAFYTSKDPAGQQSTSSSGRQCQDIFSGGKTAAGEKTKVR